MQLWTGYTGQGVTAQSDRELYAAFAGTGSYVTNAGSKLTATMSDANHLSIMDGAVVHHGAHITLDGTEEWIIPVGAQGAKRSNIACIRYISEQNGEGATIERVEPIVLSGEPTTSGDPVDPQWEEGSILDNVTTSDMPLYRVVTDGINVLDPVPMFQTLVPMADLRDSVSQISAGFGVSNLLITFNNGLIHFWITDEDHDRWLATLPMTRQ